MQERIYKVSDTFDQVTMKIKVDWSHPDASAGIREMSTFWAGHPRKQASDEEHFLFLSDIIAATAYSFSRADRLGYCPEDTHDLVFNSEGFCGSEVPWIKVYDFVDDTSDVAWEVELLEDSDE